MKNLHLPLILVLIVMVFSCKKESTPDPEPQPTTYEINGHVQKGPYLNGTAITIAELQNDLIPTGKNFTTQILDNTGTFELKNAALLSSYVELKADGFYFNEVQNEGSTAQLTLFALSDLKDRTSVNVNVLSELEKRRVEYLISNGSTYGAAKQQAQAEVLSIFEVEKNDIVESENLDISQSGDDNAILLAVSVILQGYLSVAELSELLANISTDIREDGVMLDDSPLGTILVDNARLLRTEEIRSNLEERYLTLGANAVIPDFEKYIQQFIDNTPFKPTELISYPASGKHGINILDKEKTEYLEGTYSMSVVLVEGTNLKVKISGQMWFFRPFQESGGWEFSALDPEDSSRIYTSIKTGELDFEILLNSSNPEATSNVVKIEVYENDAETPTWSKEITVVQ